MRVYRSAHRSGDLELTLFPRRQQYFLAERDIIRSYLHHGIHDHERSGPRKCQELPGGGRDERPGGQNGGMHARPLRLKGER